MFGGTVRPPMAPADAVHRLSDLGAYGVTFHDNDVFPFGASGQEREQHLKPFRKALEGTGLAELWDTVLRHRQVLTDAGEFDARRRTQQVDWTWAMVRDTVLDRVLTNRAVKSIRAEVERQVRDGELTPALAAQQILDAAGGR